MNYNEAIRHLRQINPKHIECVELVDMKEVWDNIPQSISIVEKALKEIQQYRVIGTVEECREAMERQRAKKPRFYAHNYYCGNCGNLVGNDEFKWKRFMYCDKCGHAVLWERDAN